MLAAYGQGISPISRHAGKSNTTRNFLFGQSWLAPAGGFYNRSGSCAPSQPPADPRCHRHGEISAKGPCCGAFAHHGQNEIENETIDAIKWMFNLRASAAAGSDHHVGSAAYPLGIRFWHKVLVHAESAVFSTILDSAQA
jgi:hypothetical protein